jgi:hypothetical protein
MQPSFINFLVGEKDWFVERMQALDYRSDPIGIRFGMAYMGGQAILSGEIAAFNLRLALLRFIPVSDLALKIEEVNQLLAKLTNEARLEALRQLRGERGKGAQKKLLKDLSKTEKRKLVKRVAENLKAKVDKLPPEERGLLDIQPFLDGVELYHQAYIYPHLFAKKINTSEQKIGSFLPLLMAVKSQRQGEIIQVDKFSGIYNNKQLREYFRSLSGALGRNSHFHSSMVVVLSGMFHTLAVGYDFKSKHWILVNPAELPAELIEDEEQLIEKVSAAFSHCPLLALASEIYVLKDRKNEAKKQLRQWHQSLTWKNLHRVTKVKAKEVDFSGTSWLWMAARQGQHRIVKALLKAGANPNQARVDEVGPLYIAVKYGHEEIVETLMDQGADPSQADTAGVSPLLMAGRQRDIEIIRILLGDLSRKKD